MESAIRELMGSEGIDSLSNLIRKLIFHYPSLNLTFNHYDLIADCVTSLGISLPSTSYTSTTSPLYHSYSRSIVPDENFLQICSNTTRAGCNQECTLVHFQPIMKPYTDAHLGHCSYLNTCYPFYNSAPPSLSNAFQPGKVSSPRLDRACKYLHFELEQPRASTKQVQQEDTSRCKRSRQDLDNLLACTRYPAQYLNCDLRSFDYSTLGKFQIIVADPPWDIHMSLPYGTVGVNRYVVCIADTPKLTDDEMRKMPMSTLSEEGTLIFLWVTGRAMDLGRECLSIWGWVEPKVEEIAWVKINQLQRLIRTGRTGHWLNHTKEHCLVGIKVAQDGVVRWPEWLNKGLDCDVIVSEVRETSRKPDELYGMIERCCPSGRKVELFGRRHNGRDGWLTLGNQIGEDVVHDEALAERLNARCVVYERCYTTSLHSDIQIP
ncbi:hypothetical protein E3P99_01710 [Wallemia hederae]|uniref:mRNA m(6)A methyltransferase n=1 Tax=Wallemia hederae TaxID=1540922 RepID=A0A4T0FP19_9BASI|nr:hypothetical protein E3P99_01710 [Wallemia hederae]